MIHKLNIFRYPSFLEIKNFQTRLKSTKQWHQRHVNDQFVKKSQVDGYRARSAYKLIEVFEKFKLLNHYQKSDPITLVDLGAAPGSWCQVLQTQFKNYKHKKIVAVDLLDFIDLDEVIRFKGDFTSIETLDKLDVVFDGAKVDLIVSDVAPSFCGTHSTDHARSHELNLQLLQFCQLYLKPDGCFVSKYIRGEEEKDFQMRLKSNFAKLNKPFKPISSRKQSSEVFFVAEGFKSKTS